MFRSTLLWIHFLLPLSTFASNSLQPVIKYWQNPPIYETSRSPQSLGNSETALFKLTDKYGREYYFDTVKENCLRTDITNQNKLQFCY